MESPPPAGLPVTEAFLAIQPSADTAATALAIAWVMMKNHPSLRLPNANHETHMTLARQLAELAEVMTRPFK